MHGPQPSPARAGEALQNGAFPRFLHTKRRHEAGEEHREGAQRRRRPPPPGPHMPPT